MASLGFYAKKVRGIVTQNHQAVNAVYALINFQAISKTKRDISAAETAQQKPSSTVLPPCLSNVFKFAPHPMATIAAMTKNLPVCPHSDVTAGGSIFVELTTQASKNPTTNHGNILTKL